MTNKDFESVVLDFISEQKGFNWKVLDFISNQEKFNSTQLGFNANQEKFNSKQEGINESIFNKIDSLDSKIDAMDEKFEGKFDRLEDLMIEQNFQVKQEVRMNTRYIEQAFNRISDNVWTPTKYWKVV